MLTDEQIADALNLIDDRYQRVTQKYLQKVGQAIQKIGKLNQSSINLLIQLRRMGADVQTIERELQKTTKLTKKDIKALYEHAAEEANTDARFSYISQGVEPDSIRWQRLVESIWMQTAGTMDNLSKTTVVAESYRQILDEAVQAVSMGVTDYNSVIRESVKKLGSAGLQVKYASGAKKRLDSAVRMNVLDGVRQVQQKAQELIGEEIGADGVQLTAHPMSAPDHEPVQGRIFDKENFQLMQSGRHFRDVNGNEYKPFSRPITQWHCRHLVYYILLGISKPLYSPEELERWRRENARGVSIGGKHYTRYEATQLMRKLELQMRRQKDTAILAKASGDDVLRRECQSNISQLTAQYKTVAEAAGLGTRFEKTYVEGFKPLRDTVFMNPPKDLKELSASVDKELDHYCSRKSKWSGNTIIRTREEMPNAVGRKEWNCDISLRDTAGVKTVVHEHLHARSISYYDEKTYLRHQEAEEAAVEMYAQEICRKNGVPFKEAYGAKVKQLRIINSILRNGDGYSFAKALFDIPLPERYNWLKNQADELILQGKLKKQTVQSLEKAVEFFHEKEVK